MSEMIERLVKELELATANAPFYVLPVYKNKYNVMEIMPPNCVDMCHLSLAVQDVAEDACSKLNNEWIIKQIIKALAPATSDMQNEYYKMAMNEGHTKISACFANAMWERAIDAILKS